MDFPGALPKGAVKRPEFRYRPTKGSYTPLTNTMIVEIVRDQVMLDKDLRPVLTPGGIIYPDTARMEGWRTTDPVVRVVAAGPEVKDKRIKPGAFLLVPARVLGQSPLIQYQGTRTPPDVDVVYWVNETNVASIIDQAEGEEILRLAVEAAEAGQPDE